MTTGNEGRKDGDIVRSLARGLAVLKSFTSQHTTLSVTQVAERTGLSRAAVRRLLITLENLGYVRSEHQRYALRPKVLELGHAYLTSLYPWDSALPVMQAFSAAIDENCLAGVLDDLTVVCVARTARRSVPVSVPVGGRLPAYASSMGRVLLADLDEATLNRYFDTVELRAYTPQTLTDPAELRRELARVRKQGWSLVEHEIEADVIGIAAPIFGAGGRVVAALNVSTHEHRLTSSEVIDSILPALLDYSKELSLLFGGVPAAGSD
jgi:IclR family pca regulon transcriptional regulator